AAPVRQRLALARRGRSGWDCAIERAPAPGGVSCRRRRYPHASFYDLLTGPVPEYASYAGPFHRAECRRGRRENPDWPTRSVLRTGPSPEGPRPVSAAPGAYG